MLVREWNGNIYGSLTLKPAQRASAAVSRKCVLCERRSGVETYRNRLGMLVNVNLCSWHMPMPSHLHLVYDFYSLLSAMDQQSISSPAAAIGYNMRYLLQNLKASMIVLRFCFAC